MSVVLLAMDLYASEPPSSFLWLCHGASSHARAIRGSSQHFRLVRLCLLAHWPGPHSLALLSLGPWPLDRSAVHFDLAVGAKSCHTTTFPTRKPPHPSTIPTIPTRNGNLTGDSWPLAFSVIQGGSSQSIQSNIVKPSCTTF